jgi:hypothetical protein
MRHAEVAVLQRFLIARDYLASDNATGYFGKLTLAALKKYQCDTEIVCAGDPSSTGYGQTGPKTRAMIGK